MTKVYEFRPDYAIHPGEYIAELLEVNGMKQTELALRLGITPKHLSNIINGKVQITPEMAKSLQNVFNYPAGYWLSLQAAYDIANHEKALIEKYHQREKEYSDWLAQFDYKSLIELDYIPDVGNNTIDMVNNLLSFFACSDIDSWNNIYCSPLPAACRITGASRAKKGNSTAWIRRGYILGQQQIRDMPDYNRANFKAILSEIRKLTIQTEDDFANKMMLLCREAGVCLLFVKEIPRSGISGAAFWINGSIPCIQICLRYKKNDHFWFTFFHEAAHILKEHKKTVYFDCDTTEKDDTELEANQIACDILIPKKKYTEFINSGRFYEGDIKQFATSIEIHPGIIVGRLQHEGKIKWEWHNKLKESFRWEE